MFDIGRLIPLLSGLIANNMISSEVELSTLLICPTEEKRSPFFYKYKNHPSEVLEQVLREEFRLILIEKGVSFFLTYFGCIFCQSSS